MRTTYLSVTPLLYVATAPMPFYAMASDDAETAVYNIRCGDAVRVPTLEMARDVLLLLGLDEAAAEDRIHFAVTGRILKAS